MKTKLTDERKGQIALEMLRDKVNRGDIKFIPDHLRRDLGNFSKKTGIPLDELFGFVKVEMNVLMDETFKKKSPRLRAKLS